MVEVIGVGGDNMNKSRMVLMSPKEKGMKILGWKSQTF
jgi:hypothetical protein